MSDFDVVNEIKKYDNKAKFVMDGDICKEAHFVNENEIFFGTLRTLNSKEKKYVLRFVDKLKNLEVLNLRKNCLGYIDNLDLPKLKYLDLASNYMGSVSDFFKFCNLEYLSLGVNDLKCIPDFISNFCNLKTIKLHKNEISDVSSISNCRNLQFLNLYLNSMNEVPKFIFSFEKIEFFSWGISKIKSFPEEIENWKNLKWLSLVANHLQFLPETICLLTNLNGLRIHKNHLVELPSNIGNLKKLKQISLYCNKLKFLPDSFFNLKLEKCNISYNEFIDMPKVESQWLCIEENDCLWSEL